MKDSARLPSGGPQNAVLPAMLPTGAECLIEQIEWVRSIARQIRNRLPRSVALEDLVSAGLIGLLVAMRSFDQSRGVQFRCYARSRVRGAILDSLRESDWAPRDLRRKARDVNEAYRNLSVKLSRCPTEVELAGTLGMSLHDLQQLKRDLEGLKISSLDEVPFNEPCREPVCEHLPGKDEDIPFNRCLRAEIHDLLGNALAEMPESARRVIVGYYFEERTMKEVGATLGVGESRVSQVHKLALQMLRERIADSPQYPLPPAKGRGFDSASEVGKHTWCSRVRQSYGR